uniref:Uncharacterized protein n=1 Tax=Cacopsylla melanoneura TaxID=428564 RepID=A0A8D9E5P8_9HEMI
MIYCYIFHQEEMNIEKNAKYPSTSKRKPGRNSNVQNPTKRLEKSQDIEQWSRNGHGKYVCDPQTMGSSKMNNNNINVGKTSKMKQKLLPRYYKKKTDQQGDSLDQDKEPLLK